MDSSDKLVHFVDTISNCEHLLDAIHVLPGTPKDTENTPANFITEKVLQKQAKDIYCRITAL